jgi:hypothetical protein
MSKHVNLVLEIKEWADDGETTLRKCRAEFSGGFDRQPWANSCWQESRRNWLRLSIPFASAENRLDKIRAPSAERGTT